MADELSLKAARHSPSTTTSAYLRTQATHGMSHGMIMPLHESWHDHATA